MSDVLDARAACLALHVAVIQAGSMAKWARAAGVPVSVVSETLAGKREMGEPVANALGLIRQTVFRRVSRIGERELAA